MQQPTTQIDQQQHDIGDYVRGTLDAASSAAIEKRLAVDADLAALVQQERQLQAHFAQQRAEAVVPATSFAALRSRLQTPTFTQRLVRLLASSLPQPSWGMAAALLVVVAAVSAIWQSPVVQTDMQTAAVNTTPEYHTLTSADSAAPSGAEWRLVFAAGTSPESQGALLQDFALVALSTPDRLGSVWARSATGAADPALAARLLGDRRIAVAQAVARGAVP